MRKILLVEDSPEVFTMVEHAITNVGELDWAKTVAEANDLLDSKVFDLCLLDIELPDGNGVSLCADIQARFPNMAIFFLSSHTDLSEKVLGFAAGADDYITKPFAPLELRARIESRLRKIEQSKKSGDVLRWPTIQIDKAKQEVQVLINQEFTAVNLTALEFRILTYFAASPDVVINRDQMLNDIWGEDVHVYPRSVDTHVSKLRRKLGEASDLIESVHGVGYKFKPVI